MQKTFTVDFLQKKMKVNEGEVPQYYVENSHPAIIEPLEWDLAQAEFTRKKAMGRKYTSGSIFSNMVDHVTVYTDERVVFTFKSGAEITKQI